MAAKYGLSEEKLKHTECYNAMKIISNEISLHQDPNCVTTGWKIAFKKEPPKVELINTCIKFVFHPFSPRFVKMKFICKRFMK